MSNAIFTVKEAAEFLGVHPETVRDFARNKRIPAAKMGKAWRFCREDLLRFISRGGTLCEKESEQET